MTREDALKLLQIKYEHTYEEEKTYDDFAYCEGKRHGLREAGSIVGMIDKSNKIKSSFDLNKACEWLRNNMRDIPCDPLDFVTTPYDSVEEFISAFRKEMEE